MALQADDTERKVLFSGLSEAEGTQGASAGEAQSAARRGSSFPLLCPSCGLRPGLGADRPQPGAEKLPAPTEGQARQDAGGGTTAVTAEVAVMRRSGRDAPPHRCARGPNPAPADPPAPAPARLPCTHSTRPPRLESRGRRSAPHPPRVLRVSDARLAAPPTWPREPAPRITWRRRPALAHQSAPAERLRSSAQPNQRPRGALAPPLPSRAPALRLKGPEGSSLPTAGPLYPGWRSPF